MLMESNAFRRLSSELRPLLIGSRIEKIFEPSQGFFVISLYPAAGGKKKYLLFSSAQDSFLSLSVNKPESAEPSARAMWLRKRLRGRRILDCHCAWTTLRLAWALSPGEGRFLIFDMTKGLELADELPDSFAVTEKWPALDQISAHSDIWRNFPQISPQLRKTLAVLPGYEAAPLLEALRDSPALSLYLYYRNGRPWRLLAWELPAALGRELTVKIFSSALEACEVLAWSCLSSQVSKACSGAWPSRSEHLLKRLTSEEERLREHLLLKEQAEKIKISLARFDGRSRYRRIIFEDGGRLELDPALTLLENMEKIFRRVFRARRGLETIARRKEKLLRAVAVIEDKANLASGRRIEKSGDKKRSEHRSEGKSFHIFRSSDGLIILRGKNSKANMELLRLARPFDLWFHAEDGPGAHCLLKVERNQEIPRESLIEAAVLAGLKSWQGSSGKARVICAEAGYVHAVKGGPPGAARVDKARESLLVNLDPALEARLAVQSK